MSLDVKKWVDIFEAAGIDEAARHRWHHEFEHRAPDDHQAFLEWLGMAPGDIQRVRGRSRA
jgi:hypothetical protein